MNDVEMIDRQTDHKKDLPALAMLLPKLKTVAVVVGAPKPPTLKLTAVGLAFIPNPPKLKPPAVVVVTAPSPPNPAKGPARARWRDTERKKREED